MTTGKLLLGWMTENEALDWLLSEALFDKPMSRDDAVKLWKEYRDRLMAIPPRIVHTPSRLRLTTFEKIHANKLLKRAKRERANHIKDVWKLANPENLVIQQLQVTLERASRYFVSNAGRQKQGEILFGDWRSPSDVDVVLTNRTHAHHRVATRGI